MVMELLGELYCSRYAYLCYTPVDDYRGIQRLISVLKLEFIIYLNARLVVLRSGVASTLCCQMR